MATIRSIAKSIAQTIAEKEIYLMLCGWRIEEQRDHVFYSLTQRGGIKWKVYYPPIGHPYLKRYRYTFSLERAVRSQKRADQTKGCQ